MTLTESAPTRAPEAAAPTHTEAPQGFVGVLGAGDHKIVGRLWIAASVLFLVLAGVAGGAVSVERFDTEGIDVLSQSWFAQIFTFHSLAAAFLFLLPLTIGVATLVVPLQVGAATVAFGRASSAAFWTFLLGGALVVAAYAIDGGPFGSDVDGVGLFLVAFAMVLVAQITAWIGIATTALALRAPGVTLVRTPLFSWSALVAAGVWLLTLPVLFAMVVLTYLDQRYGGGTFLGGAEGIYQRLSWAFFQPAVYAFAIPVLGVVGELVPVFSARRHGRHRIAMGCIGAFGVLSIGAWAMPSFTGDGGAGLPWLYEAPWIGVSFAILLPALAMLGLWGDTARRGTLRLASPFIYGVAAMVMLLVGLLAGAVQTIEPLETLTDEASMPLYGTTWTTAVTHYVTLAATIALFGAVVYWAPKILGRSLAEGAQKAVAGILLLGTILLAFPDLVSGLLGQPAGAIPGLAENTGTIEALNLVSAVGGGLLILGALAFVATLVMGMVSDELPGDDPWGGHTLEWATSSPPPPGNFATLPEIRSEAPLYDARHPEEVQN
jgi:heme/copper-type cytochrome/quinol oxidase subunit 1